MEPGLSRARGRVRPLATADHAAWQELFAAYCHFYGVDPSPEHLARVWDWLDDPTIDTHCLLAWTPEGDAVGLAQYRSWLWPLRGESACFLDDLFVAASHRGKGIGRALLTEVAERAASRGEPVVRWLTREDNLTARQLYDDTAGVVPVVVYDMASKGP